MIQVPLSAIPLAIVAVLAIGLACYSFGWWWRGNNEKATKVYHHTNMTEEQRKHFDAAFDRMDDGFKCMDAAFDEIRKGFK